ncbi:hypothetical protein C489_09131 [Natrinema versiforme JCM 10478]|uniref:Uncharacterized protein n=2 Tax=Natrinema versiforme TaxID=88724 RepID=L9Y1Z5_9EURY|nr:hypothetical protein C489_09131 [Natrinema versiforme JCM 10478]
MSLTFSVRNNPGRYALLLGSGVSTEAGIPTGWTVVSNLAQRVAATEETSIDNDTNPTDWYEETYDEPATYENLIEGLAKTQTERRSLLEGFFEPTEEEAERGEKTPTEAHKSIAWLVDNGYINVILTTNFDQLLEQALRDQGVNPVVISGKETAQGAEPLQHQEAVVVKVNGDYKQTNVKNLSYELESYSEPIQKIIDRVFQEYGLIICGWSGKHDTRLRQSLQECETHRYSTYWTYYSELGDVANELVSHRDGFTINHDGAISLFTDLRDRVQALVDAEEGEPLSTPIARERVKRYLPREEHRIDLADLISETAQRSGENVQDEERLPLSRKELNDNFSVEDRYQEYGDLTRTIVAEVMTCAYWGGDTVNLGEKSVSDALSTLSPKQSPNGLFQEGLNDLRRYPATLVLYGAGLAGIAGDNWDLVSTLLTNPIETSQSRSRQPAEVPPVEALHPRRLTKEWGRGFDRERAEKSLRSSMRQTLQDPGKEFLVSENQYNRVFTDFEVLFDILWYAEVGSEYVRSLGTTYWDEAVNRVEEQVVEQQGDWPPIRTGILDLTSDEVVNILSELKELHR